ncbi:MAG TPA: SRPBCC family protein [Actinomycetota bacterium]
MERRRELAIGIAGALATALFARRWFLRWGAEAEEVELPLPGDDVIVNADLLATRAVTIDAAPRDVWPWIAQLGQGRGGLYSYDRLENLFGCDIHSADEIVPAFQQIAVGDEVRLHPAVALRIVSVEPGRSLVLRGGTLGDGAPYEFTWAFVLLVELEGTTRLLVRERYGYRHRWTPLLVEPLSVVSFLMTQRMLRGIRDRARRSGVAVSREEAGDSAG